MPLLEPELGDIELRPSRQMDHCFELLYRFTGLIKISIVLFSMYNEIML